MTDEAKADKPAKPKVSKRSENWAEDQQERGYYYDDACGYEIYDPEDEDDEENDDEENDPLP